MKDQEERAKAVEERLFRAVELEQTLVKFLTVDLAEWCADRDLDEEYKEFLRLSLGLTGRSSG